MTDYGLAQDLLSRLIAVPSPSREEQAICEFTMKLCAELGLKAERVGDSIVVRVGSGGPRLLLNSHYDTVPIGEGWHGDPLDSTWRDGKLCARGANDAKSSVAAMLWATAQLAQRPQDLEGELILAITACEEVTNSGMGDVLAHIEKPDLAITGEPTGLEVVRAQSGLAIVVARWTGKSCHAAHVARVRHENALMRAARELGNFVEDFVILPEEHELLGVSTIAPTVLHSGKRHNVVPDEAVMELDARLAPPYTGEDCVALLREFLPSAELHCRSDRLRAVETAADHPLVVEALKASAKPAAIGSRTMSDMALLAGIPAIKCGPGETVRSHTPNEWVTVEELEAACKFYVEVVPAALAASAEVKS